MSNTGALQFSAPCAVMHSTLQHVWCGALQFSMYGLVNCTLALCTATVSINTFYNKLIIQCMLCGAVHCSAAYTMLISALRPCALHGNCD